MEPQAPHHPIDTWREFFKHLGIVTLSILLALFFENLVESWHHHRRFAEAREALAAEIKSNQSLLTGEAYLPYHRRYLTHYTKLRDTASIIGANDIFNGGMHPPPLRDVSWRTFLTSNVVDLMPFEQRSRLTNIYRRQDDVRESFNAIRSSLIAPRTDRDSPPYLHDQVLILSSSLADIVAAEEGLLQEYAEVEPVLQR